MENDTTETYTVGEFGKDVAKSFAIGAAQTAGAYAALLGIGLTYSLIKDARDRRAAKKTQTEN